MSLPQGPTMGGSNNNTLTNTVAGQSQDTKSPPALENAITKDSDKVDVLVVDTGAFIKRARMEALGDKLVTIEEVLQEVRDIRSKTFLSNFPFKIQTREPTPEAIKAVTAFAQQTGDYGSLSIVDLKVLALTYTIEVEANGKDHIRTEPLKKPEQVEQKIDWSYFIPPKNTAPVQPNKDAEPTDDKSDSDSEEEGWITLSNVDDYTNSLLGTKVTDTDNTAQGTKVACITFDFSIQNVLLQMNLRLIAPSGVHIKQVKRYILKCYGCFKICNDSVQLFCPHCGNDTLVKISYTVDKDGNAVYSQAGRIHKRGTKYSIPKPRGGKHNKDLILSPGQIPQWYYKHKRHLNYRDPDLPLLEPRKKSSHRPVVVGYGKRNPNEPRKRYGKKNKPRRAW